MAVGPYAFNPPGTPDNYTDPWVDALKRLQQLQASAQTISPSPGVNTAPMQSGVSASEFDKLGRGALHGPTPVSPTASGVASGVRAAAAQTAGSGSGSAISSLPTQAQGKGAPSDQLQKYIDQYSNATPFRTPLGSAQSGWYGGYTPSSLGILTAAGNEKQADYAWANAHGYGQFAQGALQDYANPNVIAQIMGITQPGDIANFYDQFNTQALTPGAQVMDPRGIMEKILSASNTANTAIGGTGAGNNALGTALYSSNHPEEQVSKVIQYTKAALQGTMSQEGLDAYLNYLTQQGQAFIDWKMRNPQLPGNFGRWVLDRSGGGVGF